MLYVDCMKVFIESHSWWGNGPIPWQCVYIRHPRASLIIFPDSKYPFPEAQKKKRGKNSFFHGDFSRGGMGGVAGVHGFVIHLFVSRVCDIFLFFKVLLEVSWCSLSGRSNFYVLIFLHKRCKTRAIWRPTSVYLVVYIICTMITLCANTCTSH